MMARMIMAALGLAAVAMAQLDTDAVSRTYRYAVYREATLAGSAEAVTVQTAAAGKRAVLLEAVSVYCSAECTVTVEIGGTAATATAGTVVARNTSAAATATAYVASDAGAGSVLAKMLVPAGQDRTMGLEGLGIARGVAGRVTVRIGSITGAVRVTVAWAEVS